MASNAETLASWSDFLACVDDDSDADTHKKVEDALKATGWKLPSKLVKALPEEVLEGTTLNPAEKAFVRRCITKAENLSASLEGNGAQGAQMASQNPVSSPLLSQQQSELVTSLQGLLGSENSAVIVAEALAKGTAKLDVTKVLREAGLEELGDTMQPTPDVFTALSLDSKAALKASHVPFTYMELTNSYILPEFMPPEAVGGKTICPGAEDNLLGCTGNFSQFSKAIHALTTAPRCFRTIAQWSTAFLRYAVAAIAIKQITWPFVICHAQMILRISMEESMMIAVIYDEIQRKAWAR